MTTWRKEYPKTTTRLSDLPEIHTDNFNVIQSASNYEHHSMASADTALSGKHRLGAVGVIFEGTTAEINALSSTCGTGAVAYDTTLGVMKYYSGSAWTVLTTNWDRLRAYRSTDIAVTADASADILPFDTEDYDTLSAYNNATGVFTATVSGYYLITANVCFVASGSQGTTGVEYATAQAVASGWTPVGVANNWQNVDEVIGAENNADYNITATLSATDGMSGTVVDTLTGSSNIAVSINYRAQRSGCVCNNTCYGQDCSCDITCYVHSCGCNASCYGYSAGIQTWSCGGKGGTCVCDIYGYSPCSCNYGCYGEGCSCNAAGYGAGAGCSCYDSVHGGDQVQVSSFLRIGGTNYRSNPIIPETSWTNYEDIWTDDPSTSLNWTTAGVSAIQAFGYECRQVSAGVASAGGTSCSAAVSVARLSADWYPLRPVLKLHVYVDSALSESSNLPIYESLSAATYHGAEIMTIKYLSAGATVDIRYQKTLLDDTITAGSTNTNLSIHRLTGPLG